MPETTSRAVRIHATGGPEQLVIDQVSVGEPGPGQVRIRHHAIGLNFIDVYQRTGLYPNAMPLALGMEGAGVIEAVGEGVTHLKVGDRAAFGKRVAGLAGARGRAQRARGAQPEDGGSRLVARRRRRLTPEPGCQQVAARQQQRRHRPQCQPVMAGAGFLIQGIEKRPGEQRREQHHRPQEKAQGRLGQQAPAAFGQGHPSADLLFQGAASGADQVMPDMAGHGFRGLGAVVGPGQFDALAGHLVFTQGNDLRSEERRVGTECHGAGVCGGGGGG